MLKFLHWITVIVGLIAGLATIYSVISNHPEVPLAFSGYFTPVFFIANWVVFMIVFQLVSVAVFWKLGLWGAKSFWRSTVDGSYPGISLTLLFVILVVGLSEITFAEVPYQFLFWLQIGSASLRSLFADLRVWADYAEIKLRSANMIDLDEGDTSISSNSGAKA